MQKNCVLTHTEYAHAQLCLQKFEEEGHIEKFWAPTVPFERPSNISLNGVISSH